jgi:hypothetical protein
MRRGPQRPPGRRGREGFALTLQAGRLRPSPLASRVVAPLGRARVDVSRVVVESGIPLAAQARPMPRRTCRFAIAVGPRLADSVLHDSGVYS